MSSGTDPGDLACKSKKYSEVVKGSSASARIADCDLWLYELHLRMNQLEEFNIKLIDELAGKDKLIKNLEREVEKLVTGNGQTTSIQGRSWSSFLQKGYTKQKTTEQDMVF